MIRHFHRIVSNCNLAAVLLGMNAWGWWKLGRSGGGPGAWMLAAVFAITGAGLLPRWRWARWAGIALILLPIGLKIHTLTTRGVAWQPVVQVLGFVFVIYQLWRHPDRGLFEEDAVPLPNPSDKPPLSLVLFGSRPWMLDETALAQALSSAWGLRITTTDEPQDDADGLVGGTPPHFLVAVNKLIPAMLVIHNLDTGYFDDPEALASAVPNLRLARIIREHRAWLSVDYLGEGLDEKGEAAVYRMIGKAVAALADEHTMSIYSPAHHRCNLWSHDHHPILCGTNPLEVFGCEVKPPVIKVPDGETLEAAYAEARERWPEFVAAYQNRKAGHPPFLVKAPFAGEDGFIEHLWLKTTGLEAGSVEGCLINDPIQCRELSEGSTVSVPVAEISDWLCLDAEERPLGNFTHHLVESQALSQSR